MGLDQFYCKYSYGMIVPYLRTNQAVDQKNTMNHGGRRRTTAAMVTHPRLRCAETLAIGYATT